MQEILGELILARVHAGPVFALAQIQENVLTNCFPHFCQNLEGVHFGEKYRNKFLANDVCTGFVPGCMRELATI